MVPLPMMYLIEKVIIFPEPEAVRLAGPAELDLTLTDQAKFIICNHTMEQDHRAVKQVTRPMLGFKPFEAGHCTLVGIGIMHMIRKDQLTGEVDEGLTPAEQFYSLAV